MRSRIIALALAASTALAPVAAHAQRSAGLRPDESTVEGGLWALSDKAEAKAKQSGELNADPALNAYVREVACRVAAEYCGDIRVYVMDRPFFNAGMAPNGYMEVWSGSLLRARDEAELAFVLGHEATHFAQDHMIERWQAAKARATGAMLAGIAIQAVGAAAAVNTGSYAAARDIMDVTGGLVNIVYLGTLASLFGFSREQETQADELGLKRAAAAGYSPSAGVNVWTALREENAASEFGKVRRR